MRSKVTVLVAFVILGCFALTGCDTTPPVLNGLEGENVEIECGTDFNLTDYVSANLAISDETDDGVVDYQLNDLEYTISCSGDVYDTESGAVDTGEIGVYEVVVTVKDESNNESQTSFAFSLNPLIIEKDFYVYKEYDDRFAAMGFCSFENRSRVTLDVSKVEFQYIDKDGVTIGGTDMVDYAPQYLAGATTGYALDNYGTRQVTLATEDAIQEIIVNVDYSRASSEGDTTLEVGDITRIDDYQYNQSHFAGEAIISNPFDKNVEYYEFLVGMYDANGQLIGVMDSIDNTPINANSKTRVTASWLPESSTRPDATASMKGAACVRSFAG